MAAALHDRLQTDLQALVQGLALVGAAGIVGDIGQQVFVQTGKDPLLIGAFPCVVITAQGESEEEGPDSTFEDDSVTYPARLLICDSALASVQQARAIYAGWRHTIAQTLRGLVAYPLLPNCPELVNVEVRNLAVFPEDAVKQGRVVSGLVALCDTTEPRLRNR